MLDQQSCGSGMLTHYKDLDGGAFIVYIDLLSPSRILVWILSEPGPR